MKEVIIVTGGFDPLHSGHIAYFHAARELDSSLSLVVGVNSDAWLTRKKSKPFMPIEERVTILKELKSVDVVIEFNDKDDSACDAIRMALEIYDRVIFANGGDRHNENTLEYITFKDDERVIFKWGVGGTNKLNSSSWILDGYYAS
jgi:cytidyltransferase-like protein